MKPVKMCSVQSCDFCVTDEKVFETWKRTECFGESNCANGDDAYENCSRRKAQFMFKTAADEDVCWEQCAPHGRPALSLERRLELLDGRPEHRPLK